MVLAKYSGCLFVCLLFNGTSAALFWLLLRGTGEYSLKDNERCAVFGYI